MDIGISIILGIGLAAAVGFRVFVPFLFIGVAFRFGYIDLSDGFAWLGSVPAIILLSTATILEIIAYFIPWFDNLLDTIMTPLALVAGTIVMASTMVDIAPWIRWTLAIIAGGGTAGLIKTGTATTRVVSTAATGGLGNPLIAFIEFIFSSIISLLAILLPFVAITVVVLLILIVIKRLINKRPKPSQT